MTIGQNAAAMALLCLLAAAHSWLRSMHIEPDLHRREIRNALVALGIACVFGLLSVFSFVGPGSDPTLQPSSGITFWLVMTLVAFAFVIAEAVRAIRVQGGKSSPDEAQTGESAHRGPPDDGAAGERSVAFVGPDSSALDVDMSRVDDPRYDPWAGMHGAFAASPADLTVRHDEYLAKEDPE